jgi:hypothetical protein
MNLDSYSQPVHIKHRLPLVSGVIDTAHHVVSSVNDKAEFLYKGCIVESAVPLTPTSLGQRQDIDTVHHCLVVLLWVNVRLRSIRNRIFSEFESGFSQNGSDLLPW